MEFVAGLILGSIFGVVVDRAWARFEQRIQISIEPSFFVDVKDGEGIALKITNLGASDLPDYKLGLKFPSMGQIFFDFGNSNGPQGPAEQREHRLSTKTQFRFKGMFESRGGAIVEKVLAGKQRPHGLVFRLVMKRGEKVLFEDSQIGDALFEAFVATTYQGKQGEMDWESLRYKSPFSMAYVQELSSATGTNRIPCGLVIRSKVEGGTVSGTVSISSRKPKRRAANRPEDAKKARLHLCPALRFDSNRAHHSKNGLTHQERGPDLDSPRRRGFVSSRPEVHR